MGQGADTRCPSPTATTTQEESQEEKDSQTNRLTFANDYDRMDTMNTQEIITFLNAKPGSIAAEIGVPNATMKELEDKGQVTRIGNRKTGQRGRPPVEWVAGNVTVEVQEKLEERPKPKKAAPELPAIPDGLDAETLRKIDYIDRQVNSGLRREDDEVKDVTYLMATRRDILRRARPKNNPLNVIKPEVEYDEDEEVAVA